jgi:hypothetical protein
MKRNPCSEKAPDLAETKAPLEVDDARATTVVEVPKLPIAEEERIRISSVYTSHDEAEPSNM